MSSVDEFNSSQFTITLGVPTAALSFVGQKSGSASDAAHSFVATDSICIALVPFGGEGSSASHDPNRGQIVLASPADLPPHLNSDLGQPGALAAALEAVEVLCRAANDNVALVLGTGRDPWIETLFADRSIVAWIEDSAQVQARIIDVLAPSETASARTSDDSRNPTAFIVSSLSDFGLDSSKRLADTRRASVVSLGQDRFLIVTVAAALGGIEQVHAQQFVLDEAGRPSSQPMTRIGEIPWDATKLQLTIVPAAVGSEFTLHWTEAGAQAEVVSKIIIAQAQESEAPVGSEPGITPYGEPEPAASTAQGSSTSPDLLADTIHRIAEDIAKSLPGGSSVAVESPHLIRGDRTADGSFAPTADVLIGTEGADIIVGGEMSDVLLGLGGNDTLVGGSGDDTIDGGSGADVAVYSGTTYDYSITVNYDHTYTVVDERTDSEQTATLDGIDLVIDVESLQFGNGVIETAGIFQELPTDLPGVVVMVGSGEAQVGDTIAVSVDLQAPVIMDGGAGSDALSGGAGGDILIGGTGDDTLDGGSGNDILLGGSGGDVLVGGAGDDIILPGYGIDFVVGGVGTDTISYQDEFTGFRIVMEASAAADGQDLGTVQRGSSFDAPLPEAAVEDYFVDIKSAKGGRGDDILVGSDGNNFLDGGTGDDAFQGNGGNDTLIGGSGSHDVAVYRGDFVEYKIETGPAQDLIVHDLVENRDGYDVLSGVELLQFHDGALNVDDLLESLQERKDSGSSDKSGSGLSGSGSSGSSGSGNDDAWRSDDSDKDDHSGPGRGDSSDDNSADDRGQGSRRDSNPVSGSGRYDDKGGVDAIDDRYLIAVGENKDASDIRPSDDDLGDGWHQVSLEIGVSPQPGAGDLPEVGTENPMLGQVAIAACDNDKASRKQPSDRPAVADLGVAAVAEDHSHGRNGDVRDDSRDTGDQQLEDQSRHGGDSDLNDKIEDSNKARSDHDSDDDARGDWGNDEKKVQEPKDKDKDDKDSDHGRGKSDHGGSDRGGSQHGGRDRKSDVAFDTLEFDHAGLGDSGQHSPGLEPAAYVAQFADDTLIFEFSVFGLHGEAHGGAGPGKGDHLVVGVDAFALSLQAAHREVLIEFVGNIPGEDHHHVLHPNELPFV